MWWARSWDGFATTATRQGLFKSQNILYLSASLSLSFVCKFKQQYLVQPGTTLKIYSALSGAGLSVVSLLSVLDSGYKKKKR